MKHLKKLSALLLVLSMVFCLAACGVDVKEDKDGENLENSEQEKVALTEEETAVVGEWKVTYGYNASEGLIKEEAELAIEFHLNKDRTGSLVEDTQTVNFTWSYSDTSPAPYNPSVYYMHFQCIPEPGAVIPGGDPIEEFYFEIDTADMDAIYLTFGNWLYLCKRG